MITVTPTEAEELVEINLRAKNVTFLKGSPSTAKSSIVAKIAKKYNLKLIDIRLSQCEPPDLNGMPRINKEKNKAEYVPMETLPIWSDSLPLDHQGNEMAGWLIFMDEMNGAEDSTQKSSYKVVFDKLVGQEPLHPNVGIVAAGNLATDNALVEELSSALKSRLCTINVRPDTAGFIKFMIGNGFSHEIISFLEFKPKAHYTFDPDTVDGVDTYACNRTWMFLDQMFKQLSDPASYKLALPLFTSAVGEGVAREFIAYLKHFAKLPKMAEILANPETAVLPKEPGSQYAITGAIADNATPDTIPALMKYINRLPMDYQVVTLRSVLRKGEETKDAYINIQEIQDWLDKNSALIF